MNYTKIDEWQEGDWGTQHDLNDLVRHFKIIKFTGTAYTDDGGTRRRKCRVYVYEYPIHYEDRVYDNWCLFEPNHGFRQVKLSRIRILMLGLDSREMRSKIQKAIRNYD